MTTSTDEYARPYFQGGRRVDGFHLDPLTIGYGCIIEEAYDADGKLEVTVNSGLPERKISLWGKARGGFLKQMSTTPDKLKGRRVSVLLNSGQNIGAIAKR